jgi:hypothetical protein
LEEGAAQDTTAELSAAVAVTLVGAVGTVIAVIEFDGADAGPGPLALVATTVKV